SFGELEEVRGDSASAEHVAVDAAAERPSCAVNKHNPHRGGASRRADRLVEVVGQRLIDGVEALRPVEDDAGERAVDVEQDRGHVRTALTAVSVRYRSRSSRLSNLP